MRLQVDNPASLTSATGWAARLLPTRPAMPVLAALRVACDGADVTVSAFDYETSGQARIADAGVIEGGVAVVPGAVFAQLVAAIKPASIHTESGQLHLVGKTSKASLPLMDPDLYPEIPEPPATTLAVAAEALVRAVAGLAPMVADPILPELSGIHICPQPNGGLHLEATNRYIVGRATLGADGTLDGAAIIPPAPLQAALKGAAGAVQLGLLRATLAVRWQAGDTEHTSTLRSVAGDYPRVDRLLEQGPDHVTVDAGELRRALAQIGTVAPGVDITVKGTAGLLAAADTGNEGTVGAKARRADMTVAVPLVESTADVDRIRVNHTYLTRAVELAGDGPVQLFHRGALNKPVVVAGPAGTTAVMPIRQP